MGCGLAGRNPHPVADEKQNFLVPKSQKSQSFPQTCRIQFERTSSSSTGACRARHGASFVTHPDAHFARS